MPAPPGDILVDNSSQSLLAGLGDQAHVVLGNQITRGSQESELVSTNNTEANTDIGNSPLGNPVCRATPSTQNKLDDQKLDELKSTDRVVMLLEGIVQGQSGLRSVIQEHQRAILGKLDELTLPSASSDLQNNYNSPMTTLDLQSHPISPVTSKEKLPYDCTEDLDKIAHKWFRKIDQDSNGNISKDELKQLLTAWTMSARPLLKDRLQIKNEDDVDKFVEACDRNGDGVIDESEFIENVKHRRGVDFRGALEAQRSGKIREKKKRRSTIERIVSSKVFEAAMSFCIALNMIIMFWSLQLQGLHEGWKLGLRHEDPGWSAHQDHFNLIEALFNTIYLIEIVLRLFAINRNFHKQYSNLIDSGIVAISCLDSFVLQPMEIHFVNVSTLRILRLTRLFRFLKVLRFSDKLSELRVLIHTLCQAFRGVVWSMVFLGFIITTGSVLMTQLVITVMEGGVVDVEEKEWLYTYFGTVMMSMYTMFECTFTGHWWAYTRPLIEDIHYAFAVFWVLWVILVNFTTMRIVSAIFLKQTMNVSVLDAEKCAMNQLRRKGQLSENLRLIFQAADTSGDGAVSQEEFDEMLKDDIVVEQFADMGLDIDEICAFFTVITSDDGLADYNEFISGALSMATSAPSLDNLKSLQNQLKMGGNVQEILDAVKPMKNYFTALQATANNGGGFPMNGSRKSATQPLKEVKLPEVSAVV